MSIGLLALLDDVAAIAKVAAASLDDVAAQAAKAGMKTAGVVVDDAAVTPRFVLGFAAKRELPIVGRIAIGSLRNKLLLLLPVTLALSYFLPWMMTLLLMLGGAYLCYEGAEKIFEAVTPNKAHAHEAKLGTVALNPQTLEDEKVASAIKTDFILSAEIMTIALAAIPESNFWMEAITLAVVGALITVAVYGTVALIVKMDDIGLHMAATGRTAAWRGLGRGLVAFMPKLMAFLSIVGTAAMLWVGGSIVLHGASDLGWGWLYREIHHVAEMAAHALPQAAGFVAWTVTAALDGVFGLVLGLLLIPLATRVIGPVWASLTGKPKAAH